jgi:hypothetical protein
MSLLNRFWQGFKGFMRVLIGLMLGEIVLGEIV